jgi:hypothetical protein
LAGQREVLDGQAARLEETFWLLQSLASQLIKPEPEGPRLGDLLAELIVQIKLVKALSQQTLAAVQRQGGD